MEGVIFDFNGTLFWDSQKHYDAWLEMSKRLRGTPFDDYEMIHYMFGRTNAAIVEYALGYKPSKEDIERYSIEKEQIYLDMCKNDNKNTKLAKGVEDFLDFLCEKNIPHTIATGSEKTNVDFFVETFNLKKWFDIDKIVYDDYKIAGKPSPDIYLKALDILKLNPQETLVFEDSYSGIRAANNANVGTLIAINDNPDEFQHKDKVYTVIKDFTEFDRTILD